MGAAIATRLLGQGHAVSVWNRTPAKTAPLVAAGAKAAESPAALASASEAIITILTDAAAIDAAYTGPAGLLAGDVKGKLFGFAGATDADFARAKPLLEQMCRRIEHVGPVGAGASMKLAINLPLLVYWQALGEALSLARPLGLEPARIMDILADTSGAPNMLKNRAASIATQLAGGDVPPTVEIDVMRKDLRTMIEESRALGVALPVTARALECFDRASRDGLGAADCTKMPAYWVERGGR